MEVKQVFNFYLQVTVLVILTLKQLCQFYSKIVTGQHSKKDKRRYVTTDKTFSRSMSYKHTATTPELLGSILEFDFAGRRHHWHCVKSKCMDVLYASLGQVSISDRHNLV